MILEEDPAVVVDDGADARPPDFVPKHLENLVGEGAECAGVKQLFARIQAAAEEITRELARAESNAP